MLCRGCMGWVSPKAPNVANTVTPCDRVKARSLDEWSDWGWWNVVRDLQYEMNEG